MSVLKEGEGWAAFGKHDAISLWIGSYGTPPESGIHLAFTAASEGEVGQFYREALAAGGKDNGEPGLRAHYAPNYYAAFVYDPDGHNVEAVFREPE